MLGSGKEACILEAADTVLKISHNEDLNAMFQESNITAALLKIDPDQERFVSCSKFVRMKLDDLDNLQVGVKGAYTRCFLHNHGSTLPQYVTVGRMKKLDRLEKKLAPAQMVYLEDSIKLLASHGIVHNDIHLDNIMILTNKYIWGTSYEAPVLIDWGQAMLFGHPLTESDYIGNYKAIDKDRNDLAQVEVQEMQRFLRKQKRQKHIEDDSVTDTSKQLSF